MRPAVKVRYEHIELALQLARETNAQRFFEGALDLPRALAAKTGKRVVIAFDEFQAAGRLGPRVFDVMRTRFQNIRYHLSAMRISPSVTLELHTHQVLA